MSIGRPRVKPPGLIQALTVPPTSATTSGAFVAATWPTARSAAAGEPGERTEPAGEGPVAVAGQDVGCRRSRARGRAGRAGRRGSGRRRRRRRRTGRSVRGLRRASRSPRRPWPAYNQRWPSESRATRSACPSPVEVAGRRDQVEGVPPGAAALTRRKRAVRPLEEHHERAGRGVARGEVVATVAVQVAGREHLVLAAERRVSTLVAAPNVPAEVPGRTASAAVGLADQEVAAAVAGDVAASRGAGSRRPPRWRRWSAGGKWMSPPVGTTNASPSLARRTTMSGRRRRGEVGLELASGPARAARRRRASGSSGSLS